MLLVNKTLMKKSCSYFKYFISYYSLLKQKLAHQKENISLIQSCGADI